jgi:large subunit ribosomal protein L31
MKQKIHPKYHDDCKATCVCGNSFTTGSTLPEIKVEICAACHPFFTGEMKYVDTLGRVDKFKKKQDKISGKKYIKKSDRKKIRDQKEKKESEKKPKSLKEMIEKELRKNPKH